MRMNASRPITNMALVTSGGRQARKEKNSSATSPPVSSAPPLAGAFSFTCSTDKEQR